LIDCRGVGDLFKRQIIDNLDKQYRPRINEAYREARNIDKGDQTFIITPELENAPVFQKAMRGMNDTIANLRATDPSIDPNNPFDHLDALKKNLDQIGYTTDSFGRSIPADGIEAKTARDITKQLLTIADDSFPAYKEARDLYREKALKQQSVKLGQKLGRRTTNRDVIRAIQDPTVDIDFVKKGYASQASQALLDRVQGKRTIDFIDGGNKEAFAQIYSPEELGKIQKQIEIERAFNDTKNIVTANSSTAGQLSDLLTDTGAGISTAAAGVVGGLDGGISALLGAAVGAGKSALRDKFTSRISQKERDAAPIIAEMLLRSSVPNEIIQEYDSALKEMMRRRMMSRFATRAVAQPIAQSATDLYYGER
jgi:hypothetical protein